MQEGYLISSEQKTDYPWPNDATTLPSSDELHSKVTFGDYDADSYDDAIFISKSFDGSNPVIRVVSSGPFTEQFNILADALRPHPNVKMLLIDLDQDELNKEKELVFVSENLSRIVGIDLVNNPGAVRFDLRVMEPLNPEQNYDFKVTKNNQGYGIELGLNRIVFGQNVVPFLQSGLDPIDGVWSVDWTDAMHDDSNEWLTFANGTHCSKMCGDGVQIRNRLCNNPEPRNGGKPCPAQTVQGTANVSSVHVKTCRLRDCTINECKPNEIFNNGSCDPDPNSSDDDDDGTGGGGGGGCITGEPGCTGGGGGGGGGGGTEQPEDCGGDEVFDPFYHRCFKAYPYNDIKLTYRERYRVDDNGDRGYNWGYRNRTYRLGLNHPKARGMSPKETAREYCRWKKRADVVSWQMGEYTAGSGNDDLYVFVLCNIATNGMYYRGYYSDCPIGDLSVSFGYRNSKHQSGQNVQYLKSVICRENE